MVCTCDISSDLESLRISESEKTFGGTVLHMYMYSVYDYHIEYTTWKTVFFEVFVDFSHNLLIYM